MEQSLQAQFLSFFQKFSDLSNRAVKHWPLPKSAKDAEEDAGIGYEFKAIVTQDDWQKNRGLIDSFFALHKSGYLFNGRDIGEREEIEKALSSENPFIRTVTTGYVIFCESPFLLIGHIPGEETARAACMGLYFYHSQSILIESIWLAAELQEEKPLLSSGKVDGLLIDGLASDADELDEKIRQRNREQNQQTVLSWMLTYQNPERGKQSALLDLLQNYTTNLAGSVFLEVPNPTALAVDSGCDKNVLEQAARRLSAFHAIEARYVKFAYERPDPDLLSEEIGNRSCFLLTLPQIHRKNGELAIDSAVVMRFIIDYSKSILKSTYPNKRYSRDFKGCREFKPNKLTSLVGVQNGTDVITRNNKSLFKNRLSVHNTYLYLHSIPRLEQPRFAYRRSSVGFEILVDEDYFEPLGLDPYHDMAPPEPKRTQLGNWLAIIRKEWFPPKHGVPKALYCPVAHSGETDLFAYKYQADPPYYTRYYNIRHAEVDGSS